MNSQFDPNGPTTSSQSHATMSVLSMQQLHQQSRHTPVSLPSLESHHSTGSLSQRSYNPSSSTPHTPRTPNTPRTPISAGGNGPFAQVVSQTGGFGGVPSGPQYIQLQQSYQPVSSSFMPSASVAHSQSQLIAPAPTHGRPPVPLRPMPSGGLNQNAQSIHQYGPSQILPQSSMVPNQEIQPTHVVGSQGRRGILPSAPGKAAAVTGPGVAKNTTIPAKDADGKFPCPHCTKTYLHAKHLKRHLLRHTGDRPYTCVLCKDTFSRSDILKRHFQKCSLRRGNPTGATHLSHSQAHVKKSHPGPHRATGSAADLSSLNDLKIDQSNSPRNGMMPSPTKFSDDQRSISSSVVSRRNSVKRPSSNEGIRDRRSMAGPDHRQDHNLGSVLTNALSGMQTQSANDYTTMNGASQNRYPNGFYQPQVTNGNMRVNESLGQLSQIMNRGDIPYFNGPHGQGNEMDWPHMFQSEPSDNLIPLLQQSINHGDMPIKSETPLGSGSFDSAAESQDSVYYTTSGSFSLGA